MFIYVHKHGIMVETVLTKCLLQVCSGKIREKLARFVIDDAIKRHVIIWLRISLVNVRNITTPSDKLEPKSKTAFQDTTVLQEKLIFGFARHNLHRYRGNKLYDNNEIMVDSQILGKLATFHES